MDISSSLPRTTGRFALASSYVHKASLLIRHRNAEEMLNEQRKPKTSHTTNKVPFIMANAPEGWSLKKQDGVLGDVAPTVLAAMGLGQPKEMGGHSLLIKS
jgi:2,3-bisphosphoglycerate-independent phosphoglycerate mutase